MKLSICISVQFVFLSQSLSLVTNVKNFILHITVAIDYIEREWRSVKIQLYTIKELED